MAAVEPAHHAPALYDDEPNKALRALVDARTSALAPKDASYDFVAIGGGTAGLVATTGMAMLGARCAVVERAFTGGDCLVTGCVPSKALLHVAAMAHAAKNAAHLGIKTGAVEIDFPAAMRHVRTVRAGVAHDDSIATLQSRGIEVIGGEAKFTSPRELRVGGATIRFKRALIATGGRPRVPEIPGLAEVEPLTSESLFELNAAPRHLAIIGGGPIGTEIGQALARLNVRVTLLERGARILRGDDAEAANLVQESLLRDGVEIRCNAEVTAAEKTPSGAMLSLRVGEGSESLDVSHVLVATGRVPNIANLGLESAGVEFNDQGVVVDKLFRTTSRRIYAAGDVASPQKFTHAAWAQAEYAVLNAFFPVRLNVAGRLIPHATYSDPELAHVGASAAELEQRAAELDVLTIQVAENDRARTEDDTVGFARVYLKKGTDKIVAGTIVGRHAADAIVEIGAAITFGQGLSKLATVVRPYPTRSALVQSLAYAYSTSRVTPFVRRLATWWIGLLR